MLVTVCHRPHVMFYDIKANEVITIGHNILILKDARNQWCGTLLAMTWLHNGLCKQYEIIL